MNSDKLTKDEEELAYKLKGNLRHQYLTKEDLEEAYNLGMIRKSDLKVGSTYLGVCRNASEAVWNGTVFIYIRSKFGATFPEDINHPEDDNGYDLFIPVKEKNS